MQGGVSLFPLGTFFMHFYECLDFGQPQTPDDSGKCHYAFSKCGEFNCHPKPFAPFFFFLQRCYFLILLPVVTSVAGRDTL